MAAPVYVNDGGGTLQTAAAVTPALPASRVSGNLLIAFFASRSSATAISLSGSGWQIGGHLEDASNSIAAMWAWRYVTGSEAAPTGTCGGTGSLNGGIIIQLSGTDPTAPIGNTTSQSQASGTSIVMTKVATTRTSSRIVGLAAWWPIHASGTVNGGWTSEANPGSTLGGGGSLAVADIQGSGVTVPQNQGTTFNFGGGTANQSLAFGIEVLRVPDPASTSSCSIIW
jgi:hypothetical protein